MSRIIAFAGSTRTASFNKMLLRVAVEDAKRAGGEVTHIDLRDSPMPLYDGDLTISSCSIGRLGRYEQTSVVQRP